MSTHSSTIRVIERALGGWAHMACSWGDMPSAPALLRTRSAMRVEHLFLFFPQVGGAPIKNRLDFRYIYTTCVSAKDPHHVGWW